MNPQADQTSGLGVSQPPGSNDAMGQLPSIHAPQNFHAPETNVQDFAADSSALQATMPSANPIPQGLPPATVMQQQPVTPTAGLPMPAITQNRGNNAQPVAPATPTVSSPGVQAEDQDTPVDEEWVYKAQALVGKAHADPYVLTNEMNKLKAAYIKARYNKDVKVSE